MRGVKRGQFCQVSGSSFLEDFKTKKYSSELGSEIDGEQVEVAGDERTIFFPLVKSEFCVDGFYFPVALQNYPDSILIVGFQERADRWEKLC